MGNWTQTKKKPKRERYVFENRSNESLVKMPGELNGSTFQIDNLKDCEVKIYDHTNQILIDDCINCIFIIGPVKNSIYLRHCTSCKIAVTCSQFRLEYCKDLKIKLFCSTSPAIENSEGLEFGPNVVYYPLMDQHVEKAGIDVSLNYYRTVYDHSPVEGEQHFKFSDISNAIVLKMPLEGVKD